MALVLLFIQILFLRVAQAATAGEVVELSFPHFAAAMAGRPIWPCVDRAAPVRGGLYCSGQDR